MSKHQCENQGNQSVNQGGHHVVRRWLLHDRHDAEPRHNPREGGVKTDLTPT